MSRRRALTGAVSGLLLIAVILGLHTALQRQLSNAAAPPLITPSATPPAGPSATPSSIAIPGSPTPTVAAAPSPTPEPTPPAATSTPPRPTATPGAPTATQPPAATATPAPTLPPTPVGTVITDTKLGVGVYSTTMDMNTVRLFRPSAILIQEPDPRTAHNYRDNFPKALIVGRHYVPDGDPLLAHCGDPAEDHRAKGVAFADFIARSAVPLKGVVDAWVSDNEQATSHNVGELPCHADFQTGFIEELQGRYGVAAVAGNDGPGAIEPGDYPKYFAKPISEAVYFGVHSYSKPEARTMQTADASFYALRYRMIHDELVKAGVPLPKGGFLLTETGLYEGWRGLVSDEKTADDFLWLERQIDQDAYVKDQFVFGLGMQQDRFKGFEIQGTHLLELLGAYNAQHPGK